MKAAVLIKPLKFQIIEIEQPEPGPFEVRIKVKAAGICGTDLEAYKGNSPKGWTIQYPFQMGHELSGVVDKLGTEVQGFKIGDHVVPDGRLVCGRCINCHKGHFNACLNAGYTSGGFKEYSVYPFQNLVKIPNGVSFEEAALTEPLSCCIYGTSQLNIPLGCNAVVIGDGPIGLLHAQILRSRGAKTTIIGITKERLEVAKGLGFDSIINAENQDMVEEVKHITGGYGADIVISAVGNEKVLEDALIISARKGQVLYFAAVMKDKIQLDLDLVHYKELRLIGSYDSTLANYRDALKLMFLNQIDVKPLITHSFYLTDIKQAFEAAHSQQGMKIVIKNEC
ncbi:MAG: hypothetical protein APF76_06355 [Desulfitibacter sp. BRH_c19]|nr:MAG: hypothetical protein APF76_06355 [Desulfitibacter sp. BRH_c19]